MDGPAAIDMPVDYRHNLKRPEHLHSKVLNHARIKWMS